MAIKVENELNKTEMDIYEQLINWHRDRHQFSGSNEPNENSKLMLIKLARLLSLIQDKFGKVVITYGFTSSELTRYISRNSPKHTAPRVDQHSGCEINTKGNLICDRGGVACDFSVRGYECKMDVVTKEIIKLQSHDRIYYYGKNNPLHVSVNNQPKQLLVCMNTSNDNSRYPGKTAEGYNAIELLKDI